MLLIQLQMSFDSFVFAYFFISVAVLYYVLPAKLRWWLIISASIVFYLWIDPVSIWVPVLITLLTYLAAIGIEKENRENSKKTILAISITIIIGILIFYKYAGFVESSITGMHSSFFVSLAVPLGISYITFQSIGYLIEVNKGTIEAEKQLGKFAEYILFFPKLISGPVERAEHFLPQTKKIIRFDYNAVISGLLQFTWGLFKKLVIANRLALFVDSVYGDLNGNSGPALLVAVFLFAFQLYADFSGYTDMALGIAKVLGYDLTPNFNLPFSAKSMTEFWRRWHISLSSWFNTYFFTPLSIKTRNWGKVGIVVSTMLSFLVLGLWHGANWTFVFFGGIHGLAIAIEFVTVRARKQFWKKIPVRINAFFGVLYTFLFFSFSCIFFRSSSVTKAMYVVTHLFAEFRNWFSFSFLRNSLEVHGLRISDFVILALSIAGMFMVETKSMLLQIKNIPKPARWAIYYFFVLVLIIFSVQYDAGFIYDRF